MKFFLVISAIVALAICSELPPLKSQKLKPKNAHIPSANLQPGGFQTKLNHFRPQEIRTPTFNYFVNLDHYIPGGPLFFYLNDANVFTTQFIEEGLVVDVAEDVGGALFVADFRYYTTNVPTTTANWEDLEFLTLEQSLADIAFFITQAKQHLNRPYSAVILFGSGYGATMATFARKKYPHLVDAVFASSGLYRTEAVDATFYDNLSLSLLWDGGFQCSQRLGQAFQGVEQRIQDGDGDYLQEQFDLCTPLHTEHEEDIALFYETNIELINNYIMQYHHIGLQQFCEDIQAIPQDPLESFARWVRFMLPSDEDACSETNYDDLIEELQQTELNATRVVSGERQRIYQQCTQLGLFRQTNDFGFSAFPDRIDAEFHFQRCEDIFGEDYDDGDLQLAIDQLHIHFGEQSQVVSNIIFTNGNLDPWFAHGISEYDEEESYVFNYRYSSRSADLESANGWDTTELRDAKAAITQILTEWSREFAR